MFGGRSVKSENSEKECEFEISALEGSQFFPGLSKLADQKMLPMSTNSWWYTSLKGLFKNRIVVPP